MRLLGCLFHQVVRLLCFLALPGPSWCWKGFFRYIQCSSVFPSFEGHERSPEKREARKVPTHVGGYVDLGDLYAESMQT